jgi:CdiI immunity protein
MIQEDFPALEQFLGGYFHQDFLLDFATVDDVVAAFANEETHKSIRAVCDELDSALVLLDVGREKPERFLQRLGCYYNPAADGLTVNDWLNRVRQTLMAER